MVGGTWTTGDIAAVVHHRTENRARTRWSMATSIEKNAMHVCIYKSTKAFLIIFVDQWRI